MVLTAIIAVVATASIRKDTAMLCPDVSRSIRMAAALTTKNAPAVRTSSRNQ